MKKVLTLILIIFSFIIGSIIGGAMEAKEIKSNLRIVDVEEYRDHGVVYIDFGNQEMDNGSRSDSEIHIYRYEVD